MKQIKYITNYFILGITSAKAQSAYMWEVYEDSLSDQESKIPHFLYILIFFGIIYICSKIQDFFNEVKKSKTTHKFQKKPDNTLLQPYIIEHSLTHPEDQKINLKTKKTLNSPTEIEYDNYILSLDKKVFIKSKDVEYVEIPDGVEIIKRYAFSELKTLKTIKIPKSVITIEDFAFNSSSIESILIPNSISHIGFGILNDCTKLKTVKIENGVTNIGDYMFANCYYLQNVSLSDCLTSIPESCFSMCVSLEHIDIPNSVTNIGDYAFQGCEALKKITIPKNVIGISEFTFAGAYQLEIELPSTLTCIMMHAFSQCTNLKIQLPPTITHVEPLAFYLCDKAEIWIAQGKGKWLKSILEYYEGDIYEYNVGPILELPEELTEKTRLFLSRYDVEN